MVYNNKSSLKTRIIMLIFIVSATILCVTHATQVNVIPKCNCVDGDGGSISSLNIAVNIAFDSDRRGAVIQSDACGLTLPRNGAIPEGESYEGEFPWHTSIYKADFKGITYQCSATLISKTMVLTSAACVTDGAEVTPEELLVFIGAYHFTKFGGNYQQRRIKEIILHPQYDYVKLENDLGLLKLGSSIRVTDYVRPACLWTGDPSRDNLIGQELIHPGWNYDPEVYIKDELTYIRMPVRPNDQCVFQQSRIKHLRNSTSLICASFLAGRAQTCKGDAGSGLFLKVDGVSYIRGMDSASIGYQYEVICDDRHFIAVTDIVPFLPWIRQYL